MGRATILALRAVLVALLAGAIFVQVVMVPLLASDLKEELDPDAVHIRVPFLVFTVLGIVVIQVVLVCVWRLATMVRRGTVFSHAAFRYVDIIIGAFVAAAVLVFALAIVLAPGEAVAPGIVLLVCGVAVAALGIALVVLVMRMLLAQAVARDAEANRMKTELDEVI